MSLCGQKGMYVIHSLIPRQVVVLLGPGGVGHVKVPRRGRLNLDNEMRQSDYCVKLLHPFNVVTYNVNN